MLDNDCLAPDCQAENQRRLTGHKWCTDIECRCTCHEASTIETLPVRYGD